MVNNWPPHLPVVQVRVARPTDRFKEVLNFYEQGLGLVRLGEFHDHAGYSGVMLGLPDASFHLEFTEHKAGSPCPAPTKDNLLVLYLPDAQAIRELQKRLEERGHFPVEPENPYWKQKGVTIEDPDGWRVVLMNSKGI